MTKLSQKKDKIGTVIVTIIIGAIIIIIARCEIYAGIHNNSISDKEWAFMINYISDEFGTGEKFNIISKNVYPITKSEPNRSVRDYEITNRYSTLGISVSIIGYFNSQDKLYAVMFVRYNKDNGRYKAGELTFETVAANYSKDSYLKNKQK